MMKFNEIPFSYFDNIVNPTYEFIVFGPVIVK
ncbi:hypothetical protein LINPERHAP2_LOCUS40284 [Linum perenne]